VGRIVSSLVGIVAALLVAGAGDVRAGGKLRVGERIDAVLETPHPYAGQAEPGVIWSRTIRHEGATYIAPKFDRFELSHGDHVVVRSPDGTRAWRYEGFGRGELWRTEDGFWSGRIPGDTAIVELYSGGADGGYGFRMSGYARGFDVHEIREANGAAGPEPLTLCGVDDTEWARCYEDSAIYDRSRAVARLFIAGEFLCTGWLVGCEGHLITNNHCIAQPSEALNTEYEFMAEGDTCRASCAGPHACPGTVEATAGLLVQTETARDYSLIALTPDLPEKYGYLTLRAAAPAPVGERIYIPQHPLGWGKKIAVHSTHPDDATGYCEIQTHLAEPCSAGLGDVGYQADTRPGSSGSPVLAYDDHQVVALHHCGGCPNRAVSIDKVIEALGPELPSCAIDQPAGQLQLDREAFRCSDTIDVTLVDSSLQGNGKQDIVVASSTDAAVETVTLVEGGPGLFSAGIPVGAFRGGVQDGQLAVEHGSVVTLTYLDADDGAGGSGLTVERQVPIDCLPPVVSDLVVTDLETHGATIRWTTDEPADSGVAYGPWSTPGSTAYDPAPTSEHSVPLTGLAPCTEHLFAVTSVDLAGNVTTDDAGGAYHGFETVCVPPPSIPDGAGATRPLRAWIDDDGHLTLAWDDRCPPPVTNVLYGSLDVVSELHVQGALCSAGAPEVWDDAPDGNLWFLVVGTDGLATESSWGTGHAGERNGANASGQCSVGRKDPSGSCP
jgi:hypothetical protein